MAILGYNTIGNSYYVPGSGGWYQADGLVYKITAPYDATLDSISVYCQNPHFGGVYDDYMSSIRMCVLDASFNVTNDVGFAALDHQEIGWKTITNVGNQIILTSGTTYYLGASSQDDTRVYYDASVTNYKTIDTDVWNDYILLTPWAPTTGSGYSFSIYATITQTSLPAPPISYVGLTSWMTILETNIPKMLGITRSTTQLSKLMGLTLTDYVVLGDRGVFVGGQIQSGASVNVIEYITISTTGNATDFGALTGVRTSVASSSSGNNNRAVSSGGFTTTYVNIIDYFTISATGNATDFGDIATNKMFCAATSNFTNNRGLVLGGYTPNTHVIEYITISTTGNATDFGDLAATKRTNAATSNGINNRGVNGGGYTTESINVLEYVTISTTGNATDFGDLTEKINSLNALSNDTNDRGVWGGGGDAAASNTMAYVTISTTGNATDFGDLSPFWSRSGLSNSTNERGIFGGGLTSDATTRTNIIEYITVSTTGNAIDFGDIITAKTQLGGCSNASSAT